MLSRQIENLLANKGGLLLDILAKMHALELIFTFPLFIVDFSKVQAFFRDAPLI